MSLNPRPAESVHRKRALWVSAPPPGWLPSAVSFPGGSSSRPLGWMCDFGPTSSLGATTATATPPDTASAAANGRILLGLTRASWHLAAAQVSPAREGG